MSELMSELLVAEREKDSLEEMLRVIRKQKAVVIERGLNTSRIESLEFGYMQKLQLVNEKLELAKAWLVWAKAKVSDEDK